MAFADVTTQGITWLRNLVTPDVVSRVPDPIPDRLVQWRRSGGPGLPPVREIARVDVWTWSRLGDADAWALALEVRGHVWDLPGTTALGVPVYEVAEFKGPGNDDDDETGIARVWATYDLTVRAEDVMHRAAI
ncbi:MAG: hypothetical protein AAGE88_18165 [Actinomycetota bacterium]